MIKKQILVPALLAISAYAFAFDWPQRDSDTDAFHSDFGQLRGGTISSSMNFKDSSQIYSSDAGTVAGIITDHTDDFGWFESALGNAVIIAHESGISTIYGNLEDNSIPKELWNSDRIKKDTVIGVSGNSGWQEGQSCLEFKVIDSKNSAAVNPRLLLPRISKEHAIEPGTLTLYDKNGNPHNLSWEKYFQTGTYSLYRSRKNPRAPYKTTVLINGATVETITYDMLTEKNGKAGLEGNAHYSAKEIYPDKDRQLLGNIQLVKGHSTLTVSITNIIGATNSITYNIDAY